MRRITNSLLLVALLSTLMVHPALANTAELAHSISDTTQSGVILDTASLPNCTTPLKLHDGANQAGSPTSISQRGVWVNLSSYGFDNKTSSFTVGACAVDLASGASGGGQLYSRCLSPGCVEDVMDLGWDNVVSSVYLH